MIDTHAHLNDEKFAGDLDQVIERAAATGVHRIIVCGYDLSSSKAAVEMASQYESVYATVGVHPHDAKHLSPALLSEIEHLSRAPKVVAIGEIGLDFHYNFSPPEDQYTAFEAQLELAERVKLPVIVHSRESNDEALQVIKSAGANIVGCVFHYFSGDENFARQVLDEGFYIGIDGPVTYKKSETQRRVVEVTPLDRLLIETDCPYLAPIPHRGKRNEPAYVALVAEEIARIKGLSVADIDRATTENAERLFRF